MFSLINTVLILLVVSVLYFYAVVFIGKYLKFVSNRNLVFSDFIIEFDLFVYMIICKNIFDRLVTSKRDQNGGIIALKEFTNMSDPFYNGLIVSVIGVMSQDMKDKFYTFFKMTENDHSLITEVSSKIDSYSLLLMKRLNNLESEIRNTNKIAVQSQKTPVNSSDYVFNRLVESVAEDIHKLKKSVIL